MTSNSLLQIFLYLALLLLSVKPLGWYMAQIYHGNIPGFVRFLRPIEHGIYRLVRVQVAQEMNWKCYLSSMLIFNLFGVLFFYAILRTQDYLPFNPQHAVAVPKDLALNTAISFATNTNWQAYSGEKTMSYMSQMLALTTQNFLSAATGMSLLLAFTRGVAGRESQALGNFWVDTVRGVLYILLPLSMALAVILVAEGVIQNLQHNIVIHPQTLSMSASATQTIPMGPVASQVAIKQLGTNGGGFFNANAAHPFENPTPLSNLLQMLAILLIPAGLCYTYGILVDDRRQGWAILCAMVIVFSCSVVVITIAEQNATVQNLTKPLILPSNTLNPDWGWILDKPHPCDPEIYPWLDGSKTQPQSGSSSVRKNEGICEVQNFNTITQNNYTSGNMEGKETRFGVVGSALWAAATTASGNGSVNSMLDSYSPIGGGMALWMMQLGEVIFGGVGSGLYGMLLLVLLTVFVGGLMVGRTPEYLGKKIEPFEMKMVCLAVIVVPLLILVSTAIACVLPIAKASIGNTGTHGFTEILYAFTSMGNNNGSAFSGLNANTLFYNLLGGFMMLVGRYGVAIFVLAIAGSLVQKKMLPKNSGTLPTHTPLFIFLLISVVVLVGALSFFPALSLGPLVEQLMLGKHYGV